MDLPVWQALHAELSDRGFVVISIALDQNAESARPWIEAASPTHPSLIDTQHVVADLYNMVNVPTIVWIDEQGQIVRPNDVAFTIDALSERVTGQKADVFLNKVRAWVGGEPGFDAERTRANQELPTQEMQRARAHFSLGSWLAGQGDAEGAAVHFERAGELSPRDVTIRRGSMPIQGIDPMGPKFVELFAESQTDGWPYYKPLSD